MHNKRASRDQNGCGAEQDEYGQVEPTRSNVKPLGRCAANRHLANKLNGEWSALQDGWLSGLEMTAGQAFDAIRVDPDAVLLRLVDAGNAGDNLARRVIVQTLLGKLVLMAAKDPAAELGDYVAQLCVRIAGYPTGRRRRSVAANLVLDTLKAVKAEQAGGRRLRPVQDSVLESLAEPPAAQLSALEVLKQASELRLVDEPTRRVLSAIYVEGLNSSAAAERFGTTPELVRWRCSKALRRLAAHAEELAA